MNYMFVSEDCLQCTILLNILNSKDKEKWTRCLTLVYVKFDEDGNLKTYINDDVVGQAPVSKVPALFMRERDELIIGGDDVFGELSNANWFC